VQGKKLLGEGWQRCCYKTRRIITSLGKIEFKVLHFFKNVQILFFIMKSQDNLFLPYRLRDLWYEAQKNQRNMQKKKQVFQAGKTWPYRGISDICMSQKLSRKLISNTWRLRVLCSDRSQVRTTKTERFVVQLPRTLAGPFCLFHMRSRW
jgi:hypothetical protein